MVVLSIKTNNVCLAVKTFQIVEIQFKVLSVKSLFMIFEENNVTYISLWLF